MVELLITSKVRMRLGRGCARQTAIPYAEVLREVRQPLTLRQGHKGYDVIILGGALPISEQLIMMACALCMSCMRVTSHYLFPGTLGIFLATTLAMKGKSVALVERGKLLGREQEWNISRQDMKAITPSPATFSACHVFQASWILSGLTPAVRTPGHISLVPNRQLVALLCRSLWSWAC